MSRIDDEALEWAVLHTTREPDDGERAAFDAWFAADLRHQGAYLRARALQYSLDQIAFQEEFRPPLQPGELHDPAHPVPAETAMPPAAQAPAAAANDAATPGADAGSPPHVRHARNRRAMVFSGALAAGLAAVGVFALRPATSERLELVTAKGEFRKVPLADASVVNINGDSRVDVELTPSERRIALHGGEAWFQVAKDRDRPFVVSAGGVRVRAVGTAFAVRRHAGGAEVLVTEGVVEVWAEDGSARKARMAAGTRALVPDDARAIDVTSDPAEVQRRLAWRSGELVFSNATLADAVDDFNRYNTRRLVIADPALRAKKLVGTYRVDQPGHFANDVQALLKVPVAAGGDEIRIGVPPGAATSRR